MPNRLHGPTSGGDQHRRGLRRRGLPPVVHGDDPDTALTAGLTVATSRVKNVKLGNRMGQKWIYGNPEARINAAVTGVFTPTARWDYWSQPKEMRQASEVDGPVYHITGAV